MYTKCEQMNRWIEHTITMPLMIQQRIFWYDKSHTQVFFTNKERNLLPSMQFITSESYFVS